MKKNNIATRPDKQASEKCVPISDGATKGERFLEAQVSRRSVGAMLGAFAAGAGAAALSGCVPGTSDPTLATKMAAATGTAIWWGSTVSTDLVSHVGVTDGEIAIVSGYSTEDDGGGGLFYWDSSLGASDDDGGTKIGASSTPPSIDGCWVRIYSGLIDVRWFGAQSDGSADALAAIQAALDEGSVWISPGTYIIDGQLVVGSNRMILGAGAESVLKHADGQAHQTRLLYIGDTTQSAIRSSITVRDITLDGNGNNTATAGEHNACIIITDAQDVLIDHVTTHDAQGDGIHIHSSANSSPSDINTRRITVTNCVNYNKGRAGISITGAGASDVILENNNIRVGTMVDRAHASAYGSCIDIEPSVDVNLRNIIIKGNTVETGIHATSQSGGDIVGLVIESNIVNLEDRAGSGIRLHRASSFSICNNVVSGNNIRISAGIVVQDTGVTASTGRGVISNNVVDGIGGITETYNFDYAIRVCSSNPEYMMFGSLVIESNILTNSGYHVLGVSECARVVVSKNVIRDSVGSGISVYRCDHAMVTNNIVHNAGSNGILLADESHVLLSANMISFDSPTGKVAIRTYAGLSNLLAVGNSIADGVPYAPDSSTTEDYFRILKTPGAGAPIDIN